MAKGNNKEPRIVAFCCNWCAYAGADLAGVSRDRLLLKWINANEGAVFGETITDFVEKLKEIGPSPLGGNTQAPAVEGNFQEMVASTGVLNCLECGKVT